MATYSTDGDVTAKFSNITLPADLVVENYRKEAFHQINASIRKLYTVPVVSTDETDKGLLRSIEANLSAGQILLAIATVNEVENVHEYGKLLVDKAENALKYLSTEKTVLSSEAERDTDDSDEIINFPTITGQAPDTYGTFDRPMSGIQNDAIEGVVDSKAYSSLTDNSTI